MAAEVLESAAKLSQQIGARPGGTEEEQQASFLIEETLNNAGYQTSIEEFNCNPNHEMPRAIFAGVSILLGVFAILIPLLLVPAFLLAIVSAILYVLDVMGSTPLDNVLKRGISQNVIAKYVPGQPELASITSSSKSISARHDSRSLRINERQSKASSSRHSSSRKRKIILVARYDSGRVSPLYSGALFSILPILYMLELIGMVLIPVMLFVRILVGEDNPFTVMANSLVAVGVFLALIQVIQFIIYHTAAYSDGANNNASGVAVMCELASILENTRKGVDVSNELHSAEPDSISSVDGRTGTLVSSDSNSAEIKMHGKEAFANSAALPPDTQLLYCDNKLNNDAQNSYQPYSNEGIVAGRKLGQQSVDATIIGGANAEINIPMQTKVNEVVLDFNPNVPDWFKAGKSAAYAKKVAEAIDETAQYLNLDQPQTQYQQTQANLNIHDGLGQKSANSVSASQSLNLKNRNNLAGSIAEGVASISLEASKASNNMCNSYGTATTRTGAGVDAVFGNLAQAASARAVENEIAALEAVTPEEEAIAEQAAVADRTISYIPVASELAPDVITEPAEDNPAHSGPIGKTASEILETAADKTQASSEVQNDAQNNKTVRKRRELTLPSLTGAIAKVSTSTQAAPLAVDASRQVGEARDALKFNQAEQQCQMKSTLPTTQVVQQAEETSTNKSSVTSLHDQNVNEKLVAAAATPEDAIVHDVDDSDYTQNTTPTGAMAGPGYVEMPKSRGERFKNFFGRKKQDPEETSFVKAVGISANYNATEVGKARGSWESFQNHSSRYEDEKIDKDVILTKSADISMLAAMSGSPTRKRGAHASQELKNSKNLASNDDLTDVWTEQNNWDEWNGGAFSDLRKKMVKTETQTKRRLAPAEFIDDPVDENAYSEEISSQDMINEREGIRQFRHSSFESVANLLPRLSDSQEFNEVQTKEPAYFQTEVWFVALGAQLCNNAGIKAFLAEHEEDLSGAVVIELEALGAGELCQIDDEGVFKRKKGASRMKRFTSKAATAFGVKVPSAKMNWCESASYCVQNKGLQAIHLAGIKDGKPAYYGEKDDVFENLDEDTLSRNTAFVLELIRNI